MESDKNISTEVGQKNLEPISFFNKNENFVFVYKKTEKLVTAIYLVTNLFDSNEPMKWQLRKKGQELLSSMLNNERDGSKTKILEVVSFLEICSRSGLVSAMNFSILKQEFTSLISHISEEKMDMFDQKFFNIPNQSRTNFPKPELPDNQEKNSAPDIKDRSLIKDNGFRKSDRQNIIIELLRKHTELTIKDISRVIKNCSEKTIQRELVYFIEKGIIRRTGERRWSRYSLIG